MSLSPFVSEEEGAVSSMQQRIQEKLHYSRESLDFYDESIGDEGVRVIVDQLQHSTMTTQLWLSRNRIGNDGCKLLQTLLQNNTSSLKILDLAYNNIGDQGAQMIASSLERNSTLTMLYLSNNIITDGCKALDKVNFYLAINEAGRQSLLEKNKNVDTTHEEWVDEVIEFCCDERLEDHKLSCFFYCLCLRPDVVHCSNNNDDDDKSETENLTNVDEASSSSSDEEDEKIVVKRQKIMNSWVEGCAQSYY